jgi:nitrogen fixation NifU-like protein
MSADPIYTEMIIEYSRNPSNFGKIENPHIHRHDSNPLCGDSIDLYVNIDGNKITEVKFDGKGCAICMACTSVLTEMIKGKNLEEVKNFKKDDLLSELGLGHLIKTSPVRIKCALLSLKALKYGIYSYFVDKMNDVEAAGKLKEEAASLY